MASSASQIDAAHPIAAANAVSASGDPTRHSRQALAASLTRARASMAGLTRASASARSCSASGHSRVKCSIVTRP